MNKKNIKYFILIFFVFLFIFVFLSIKIFKLTDYFSFESLKTNKEILLEGVHKHYVKSVLLFIFLYILDCLLCLPIASPLMIIGGFVFGFIPAVIYVNIGAILGAALSFLIFRYLIGNDLQEKYKTKLNKFNKNLEIYGTKYLILIRLIFIIPFSVANILISLTKVPLRTFIWTTSIGILPSTIVFVYAGKNILNVNAISDIFSIQIVTAFVVLILFIIFSIFIKYRNNL